MPDELFGEVPEKIGPYAIRGRLGEGGMGAVYLGFDDRLNRPVALKHIRPEVEGYSAHRKRFRREARTIAGLNHPSIVQVFDWVEDESGDWFVMELVEGQTLRQLLEDGPLPFPRAAAIGRDIAAGLVVAHQANLVHRDLKAENVMVSSAGRVRILDFGIAKQLARESDDSLTDAGKILGTVYAMSPEQAVGNPVDPRSDLFSLGTLLYFMVTGSMPFRGATKLETLTRICTTPPEPIEPHDPIFPAEFATLIFRLLSKLPHDRPQTAAEVEAELDQICATSESVELETIPKESQRVTQGAGDTSSTTVSELPLSTPIRSIEPPPEATSQSNEAAEGTRSEESKLGRLAATLGSVATLVVAIALAVWWFGRPPREQLRVAILHPTVEGLADADQSELIAATVRFSLLRTLVGLQGVAPLAPESIDPVSGTPREVAVATAADELVVVDLECSPSQCQVALSRLDNNGTVRWTHPFPAPADDLYTLTAAVELQLRQGFGEFESRVKEERLGSQVRKQDYLAFLRVYRSFFFPDSSALSSNPESLPQMLATLEQVRSSSPNFLDALLLEIKLSRYSYLESMSPEMLEQCRQLIERARQLAPDDIRPLLEVAGSADDANDIDLMDEAVVRLEQGFPGDARVLALRARLEEKRGDVTHALRLMQQSVQRHPSWLNLTKLAKMQLRAGLSDAARQSLESVLERFPAHFDSRSLLAQIELLSGSSARAVQLYRELVVQSPGIAELSNLGVALLLERQYSDAVVAFSRALELAPKNSIAMLNLADAEFLVGNADSATIAYQNVVDLLDATAASSGWQEKTVQAQALAHLGEELRAAALIQEALRLAPNNPQVAFEASLVYALIGETSSALVNIERALDLGVDEVWFEFSWFDSIRDTSEFSQLFSGSG